MTSCDVACRLPAIGDLRNLCRSLAVLDAILSPERECRYYSFNSAWAQGEEMASMRNGSGDEYSIVFSTAGAYLRGFDHEAPMSPYANDGEVWPGRDGRCPFRLPLVCGGTRLHRRRPHAGRDGLHMARDG
ncbi:hypothetical protein ACWGCP_00065 [Streptomyces niveus]